MIWLGAVAKSAGGRRATLWMAVPVLSGLLAHWRVLASDFRRDDFLHFYDIANDGVASFLFSPYGGHFYLLRNLVFAGAYELFGLAAAPYFLLALAVHALNAALLFVVLRREAGSNAVAAALASVWSASPAHTQTLEWFSAIGHPLAATTLLLALCAIGPAGDDDRASGGNRVPSGADRQASLARWTAALVLLFAGSTCFGVGVGIAMVFPAFAWLWTPPTGRGRAAALSAVLLVAVPALYLASPMLSAAFDTADRIGDVAPPFSSIALLSIAALFAQLLLYGAGALAFLSSLLLAFDQALRLPLSLLALGGLVAAALAVRGAARRRVVAWLLLALGGYAVIALGRAWLYFDAQRDFWAAAAEPRYHYTGQLALCGAAAALFGGLAAERRLTPRLRAALLFAAAALCALNVRTGLRHELLPTGRDELARVQRRIAAAVLAQPPGAVVCLPNEPFENVDFWVIGLRGERFPGTAAVYVLWNDPELRRRRVLFVEPDPRVLDYVRRRRGRVREVLVAEGRC